MKEVTKKIRYEDDLKHFVDIWNHNKKMYKKFIEVYNKFLKAAKMEDEFLTYDSPYFLISYFNTEQNDIMFLFDSLKDADIGFDFKEVNDLFYDLARKGKASFNYENINNSKELVNYINKLVLKQDLTLLAILFYVIKKVILKYKMRLESIMDFLSEAHEPFLQYYNLIVNRKHVPDDLIDKIFSLSMHSTFAIISKNIDFEEGNVEKNGVSFINYTTAFLNYTKEHNETLKRVSVFKAKPEQKIKKEKDVSISLTPTNEDCPNVKDKEKDKVINNYIDSYFSVISTFEGSDLTGILPDSSITGYDEIMVGLLKRYEEYLDDLAKHGKCTMAKSNIYYTLDSIVYNIKS